MTMVAIDPEGAGGPEVLKLVTRPIPKPGAGEYLIQVVAAGEGTDPTCIGRRVHCMEQPKTLNGADYAQDNT